MKDMGRHRKSSGSPGSVGGTASRSPVHLAVCVVLVATAVLLIGRYFTQSPPPPAPPTALGAIPAAMTRPADNTLYASSSSTPAPAVRDPQAGTDFAPKRAPAPPFSMKPSPPVAVRASEVGINSTLGQVGLNKDNTIEVPTSYTEAAWYRLGPTPGALGPAVILGHVDSYKGPGVFFNLGAMRPGQTIAVTRADNSIARFRVDAINSYPKDLFPTEAVYGPINYAGLRLITCGGTFDQKTRSYESNIVVFASLVQP